MALASVLKSECADFSFDNSYSFAFGYDNAQSAPGLDSVPGENISFTIRNPLSAPEEGDIEKKIEFLHGTTTLAFKVR